MAKGRLRRVLAVRFSALGDVAMSIPVVYDVCVSNPDVEFVVLTRGHAAGMFINRPQNLTVEAVDLNAWKGLGGMWRLWRSLNKKYEFERMVDLHDVIRTRMLGLAAFFSGVPVSRLRKGRSGKRALTRRRKKVLLPLVSSRDRYREAFHRAGFRHTEKFNSLFQEGAPDPALFEAATGPKQEGERWVAIAPFAAHRGKIYPLDQMEEVVAEVASDPDTRVFLMGNGEKETSVLADWARRWPGAVNVAALRLGLPAELALMHYCDVMISMDSANMHLASLVGLRTISIWGATHPYCGFHGWRQKKSDMVQLDMVCRPCSVFGDKPCLRHDYQCMRAISPKLIISRISPDSDKTDEQNRTS